MKKSVLLAVLLAVFLGCGPVLAQDTTKPAAPAAQASEPAPLAADAEAAKAEALQATRNLVQNAQAKVSAVPDLGEPTRPAIIQAAAERGAQIQFIGRQNGFTGWIMMEEGAPVFIYVSEDEETIFRGMMFDAKGQPITVAQATEAQLRNPEFFGMTREEVQAAQSAAIGQTPPAVATAATAAAATAAPAQPAETRSSDQIMYDALSVSNYITLGSKTAPVLYAFIDPDCPHCKTFLKNIDKDYLQTGKLQLRLIPVGLLGPASEARAAYVIAQADPGAVLMAHAKGEKEIPVQDKITLDGQKLNVDMFHMYRFDGTPILVFKDTSGRVMMVRGEPKDIAKTFAQIAPGGTN